MRYTRQRYIIRSVLDNHHSNTLHEIEDHVKKYLRIWSSYQVNCSDYCELMRALNI